MTTPRTGPLSSQPVPALLLVLEQTLGHVVHARNLVDALGETPETSSRVVQIDFDAGGRLADVPLLGSWTTRASWRARREVLRQLRAQPADVLFVHTLSSALLLADVARRTPMVLSTDATPANIDSLASSYDHTVGSPGVERVKQRLMRAALAPAAAVVTWSHWAADSVVRDYGVPRERVQVVRPGVRLDRFRPRPTAAPRPVPRFLFVGGDFARKGGEDLLIAMQRLGGAAELDIVTARPPASTPPGVRVHTGLSHDSPELFALYEQADAFVLPTRGDAYGLVFAEAMAAGLPVVACDVGAVHELVTDGVTGLLVRPGEPDDLAAALRTLVEDPELRRSFGQRGLERARTEHDAARTNAELIDLLRDVATRGTPVTRSAGASAGPARLA